LLSGVDSGKLDKGRGRPDPARTGSLASRRLRAVRGWESIKWRYLWIVGLCERFLVPFAGARGRFQGHRLRLAERLCAGDVDTAGTDGNW